MVRIPDDMRSKIRDVLLHHDVSRAGIFGSFARGQATRKSDLDILVKFKRRKSLLDLAALEIDLERKIHRKAEVLTYDSLHPLLRKRILAEEVQIL